VNSAVKTVEPHLYTVVQWNELCLIYQPRTIQFTVSARLNWIADTAVNE